MLDRLRMLRGVALLALVLGPAAVLGVACASGGQALPGGDDGIPDQICLLNNCGSDQDCGSCSEGRRTCLVEEGRCVACDANTGEGCAEGEVCSRYGACIANGATCPTDERGVPLITCVSSKDCLPCDPLHQLCDLEAEQCVACTPDDLSNCQSTDTCVNGECVPQCPAECTVDADCASCGGPGGAANVCNAHKCSECSDTVPCGPGEACSPQGTCVSVCGTDGEGTCEGSDECSGCIGQGFVCQGSGPGVCGPNVASCADLGTASILPDPWDSVSKQCTGDAACAGLNVKINIGATLRDMTGVQQLGDALVGYDMGSCADVTVSDGSSCGVCVPCKADADCEPINVDAVGDQLFGPPGSVEASYLADQVFGANEHTVFLYCEKSGPGYGVCSVCPGYMNDCRVGGGGGGGTCDHDECTSGGPLGSDCTACTAAVCAADDYCCTTAWDATCINEVAQYCDGMSCGGTSVCAHSECVSGGALTADCSGCATTVCAADDFCCTTSWDSLCVQKAATMCDVGCAGGTCAHSECDAGAALTTGCSSCATNVCMADSFCCTDSWDALCVQKVATECAANTCPP